MHPQEGKGKKSKIGSQELGWQEQRGGRAWRVIPELLGKEKVVLGLRAGEERGGRDGS